MDPDDWRVTFGIWIMCLALIAGMAFTQIRHRREVAAQLQKQEQHYQRQADERAGCTTRWQEGHGPCMTL